MYKISPVPWTYMQHAASRARADASPPTIDDDRRCTGMRTTTDRRLSPSSFPPTSFTSCTTREHPHRKAQHAMYHRRSPRARDDGVAPARYLIYSPGPARAALAQARPGMRRFQRLDAMSEEEEGAKAAKTRRPTPPTADVISHCCSPLQQAGEQAGLLCSPFSSRSKDAACDKDVSLLQVAKDFLHLRCSCLPAIGCSMASPAICMSLVIASRDHNAARARHTQHAFLACATPRHAADARSRRRCRLVDRLSRPADNDRRRGARALALPSHFPERAHRCSTTSEGACTLAMSPGAMPRPRL